MGMIRVVRCTNAERLAYGGIEEGRFFYCTDTELMWMGTGSGDTQVGAAPSTYTFWDPDALPAVPSAQDDHFDDAAVDVKWTEWDLGVPQLVITEAGHHAILTHSTEAAGRWRGMYQTLPAGNFTIATKASLIGTHSGDNAVALALFEDATAAAGDILIWMLYSRTSGNKYRDLFAQRWSAYDTFSSNYGGGTMYPNTTTYLRIRRVTTDLYWEYSCDGVSWTRLYTAVQPFAPAHMGIITMNNNIGIDVYGYFDFFRYIASDQIGPLGKVRTAHVD